MLSLDSNRKNFRIIGRVSAGINITFSRINNDIYFSDSEINYEYPLNMKKIIDFFEKIDKENSEFSVRIDNFLIKIAKFPFGGVIMMVSPQAFSHVTSSFVFSIDELLSFREQILNLCKIEI